QVGGQVGWVLATESSGARSRLLLIPAAPDAFDCDERALAHGLAISSVQALASLGSGRGGRGSGRRCGFLCIYVLSCLYTKHEHTKASFMPYGIQLLVCHYFESLELFYN
ncbi:hypothetical protein P5705_14235, partial [Pseudomonas entomophila]|uniref:hypothetical protein n=1 Tax=Pseudomonas entomophila TaxID=312306 RepID=UPI00240739A7